MNDNPIAKEILDRLSKVTVWISAEEELTLILQYQEEQDPKILEKLFYSFGRRMLAIFHDYRQKFRELREVSLNDMVGPAALGLRKTILRFDPNRKARLISLAYFDILNAIKEGTLKDYAIKHEVIDVEDCTEMSYEPVMEFEKNIEVRDNEFNVLLYSKHESQGSLSGKVSRLYEFINRSQKMINSESMYSTWEYVELFNTNQFYPVFPDYVICSLLEDIALLVYYMEMLQFYEQDITVPKNFLRSLVLNKSSELALLVTEFKDDIILERLKEITLELMEASVPLMVYNLKYRRPVLIPIFRFYQKSLNLSRDSEDVLANLGNSEELLEVKRMEDKFNAFN